MLSEFLQLSYGLSPDHYYTFTIESDRIFEYHSNSYLFRILKTVLSRHADIVKVRRPLFSSRYVIVLAPKKSYTVDQLKKLILGVFRSMGYSGAYFISAEPGSSSSEPGGVSQILPETGKVIGTTVAETVRPLIPVLGLVILGLFISKK
jgi:hypothetical protein